MPSFGVTVNGDWCDTPGRFPPEPLESFLLPYFTIESTKIDVYDGARFEGAQLDELIEKLCEVIDDFREKEVDWPLDSESTKKYHESIQTLQKLPIASKGVLRTLSRSHDSEQRGIYPIKGEILSPRDASIATFEYAIKLAQQARTENEQLVFIGV